MLKYVDEYRDVELSLRIAGKIRDISTKPFNVMEVCGGHTMAIRKYGVHKLIGPNIRLISGPGCPVCVTSLKDIDKAIALAWAADVSICTFGDMVYVPGTSSSLAQAKAEGRDVRTVYSVHDVLNFAKEEPKKEFVFISIGFETTAPTAAAAIIEAREEKVNNFSVLALNKTMPAALTALLGDGSSIVDALIAPGHVSTITGLSIYEPIVKDLGISCAVSGFEPADILRAIFSLAELFEKGEVKLINAYERVVKKEGNKKALAVMSEVFEESDAEWRGLGVIPRSGLKLRKAYAGLDAEKRFTIPAGDISSACEGACICGDILKGIKEPPDCTLFGKACTPESPRGACMVSSEGSCAAWYKYGV